MRKFLFKSGIFIVLLGGINILLLIPVDKLYFDEYETVNKDYENYMLADSHGSVLGNCTEEYGMYNFSFQSDSYSDMYRKLVFLTDNTNVKKVFLTVDNHKLSKYTNNDNHERSIFFAVLRDNINNPLSFLVKKYVKRYCLFANLKSRDVYKFYFSDEGKEVDDNIIGDWKDLNKQEQSEKVKVRMTTQFSGSVISKKSLRSLIKIIKICKEKNIELIGIKFPLPDAYASALGDSNYRADKIFLKNNLKVYDYSVIYKNKDEYFRDQDHLNSIGGKNFCKVLPYEK